jgi:hypothetical protein
MDDGSIANTDTGKNGAVGSDVDILPNVDLGSDCSATTALDSFGVDWHSLRVDGDVSPNG